VSGNARKLLGGLRVEARTGQSLPHTKFAWLPEDAGEAVERINWAKSMASLPRESLGKASAAVEATAAGLLDNYNRTGNLDPGLRSFYAAKGVPFDTLAKLEAGELPMDAASRAERAQSMGLDPDMVWTRNDWVGLSKPREGYRGNLVYAAFTPGLADAAAVSSGQRYPLIAPGNIIGMQRVDDAVLGRPITAEEFSKRWWEKAPMVSPPWGESRLYGSVQEWLDSYVSSPERTGADRAARLQAQLVALNAHGSPVGHSGARSDLQGRAASAFDPQDKTKMPKYRWAAPWSDEAPHWKLIETSVEPGNDNLSPTEAFGSQLAQERARQAGASGSLVSDEGGASVAFWEPQRLRHAFLSLLDPAKANYAGYMLGTLPLAVGASQQKGQRTDSTMQPVLGGLLR